MTKKVIARPNTFADYDAEEEEGRPTGRRHLPMAEANQVRDTGILSFAAAQDWPHGPIENMMILSAYVPLVFSSITCNTALTVRFPVAKTAPTTSTSTLRQVLTP